MAPPAGQRHHVRWSRSRRGPGGGSTPERRKPLRTALSGLKRCYRVVVTLWHHSRHARGIRRHPAESK
eukprot:6889093-Alexandrium_andersonii.AAC.1